MSFNYFFCLKYEQIILVCLICDDKPFILNFYMCYTQLVANFII